MVKIRCRFLQGVSFPLLLLCCSQLGCAQRRPQAGTAGTKTGSSFRSHKAKVSGTTLHYVRGGAGNAVILVHGEKVSGREIQNQPVYRRPREYRVVMVGN